MNARFLVFTDLHVDIMHDGVARLETIVQAARDVDFLVQLGDLQYPETEFLQEYSPKSIPMLEVTRPWAMGRDDEKRTVCQLLSSLGKPLYSVIGNHDLHVCDKATVCRYWNLPHRYYDFCQGGVRFLALDTNIVSTPEGMVDLAYGKTKPYPDSQMRFLDPPQLQWLTETIAASKEPCVLLSHASLVDPRCGIHNREAVQEAVRKAGFDKVRLALNGHSHVDGLAIENGVPYVNINSAAYHWVGDEYAAIHYSRQLCKIYPMLSSTVPYYDPLFAIVSICDTGITIQGMQSRFVGPTPYDVGLPAEENDYPPSPCISDRSFSFE